MLDAEPFIARATPSRLNFIRNEQAPVVFRYLVNAFEIVLRRDDKTADAEDRLRHERRDLPSGCRANQLFHVVRTRKAAIVGCRVERTPITIRRVSMNKSGHLRSDRLPLRMADTRKRRC